MKIRTDFVTNSSSSSYVVARKGELTEKQKNLIIDYVIKECFREKLEISVEEIDTYLKLMAEVEKSGGRCKEMYECKSCPGARLCDMNYRDYELRSIRDALVKGMDVYTGIVSFECNEGNNANMMEKVWDILEKNNNGNFIGIVTDLSY